MLPLLADANPLVIDIAIFIIPANLLPPALLFLVIVLLPVVLAAMAVIMIDRNDIIIHREGTMVARG